MITTFFTNLLSSPNLYYNSHYEKFADGMVKCIDDEIPFEIPQSWCWVRLGSIIDFSKSSSVKPNEIALDAWILDLEDIEKDTGVLLAKKRMKDIQSKSDKHIFYSGNVLYSKLRPYLNKVIIADENGYCTSEILAFDFGMILNKYAQIYLMSPYFVDYAMSDAYGVKMPRLGSKQGNNALMPLPPFKEQVRIAEQLTNIAPIVNRYASSQSELDRLNAELFEKLKKSVLQEAIQGKLVQQDPNDEPASVLLERIKEEKAKLFKEGKLKKKDLVDSVIFKGDDNKYYEKLGGKTTEITEEIPYELPNKWTFVRLSNLCWLDDGTKASGEKLPYLDAKYHRGKSEITYLTQGKVVVPPCKAILVDGENSGEIFNITEKGYLGSTFKVLQISKCISEEWLHILLNTYRDLFKNSKVGAAIPHLNKNLFRNLIVGVPPIEEQQRITDKIEKLMKGIEGI